MGLLRRGARLGSLSWALAERQGEILLVLLNSVLEKGNTQYRQHRLSEAEITYTYGLRKMTPLSTSSHSCHLTEALEKLQLHFLLNLSRCHRRQGRAGEALKLACRALTLRPDCKAALHVRDVAVSSLQCVRALDWDSGGGAEEIKYID